MPSGTLPAKKAVAPKMLTPVAIAVAIRARLEVLRAWRMRSWAISSSILVRESGWELEDGVRLFMFIGESVIKVLGSASYSL